MTPSPFSPQQTRFQLLVACGVLLLAGAGLMVMTNLQSTGRAADELYMSVLLPPEVRQSQDRSIAQFMADASQLKISADAARAHTVKAGDADGSDEDDDGASD